jgi:hypothetical protein
VCPQVFVYPRETASVVLDQGLEWASKEGLKFVGNLVPTNQIYLLAMLFAYSFITPRFLLLVVPLFVFYLSVIALIIATLQMFYRYACLTETFHSAVLCLAFFCFIIFVVVVFCFFFFYRRKENCFCADRL